MKESLHCCLNLLSTNFTIIIRYLFQQCEFLETICEIIHVFHFKRKIISLLSFSYLIGACFASYYRYIFALNFLFENLLMFALPHFFLFIVWFSLFISSFTVFLFWIIFADLFLQCVFKLIYQCI